MEIDDKSMSLRRQLIWLNGQVGTKLAFIVYFLSNLMILRLLLEMRIGYKLKVMSR